jgi:hypothetical protein
MAYSQQRYYAESGYHDHEPVHYIEGRSYLALDTSLHSLNAPIRTLFTAATAAAGLVPLLYRRGGRTSLDF